MKARWSNTHWSPVCLATTRRPVQDTAASARSDPCRVEHSKGEPSYGTTTRHRGDDGHADGERGATRQHAAQAEGPDDLGSGRFRPQPDAWRVTAFRQVDARDPAGRRDLHMRRRAPITDGRGKQASERPNHEHRSALRQTMGHPCAAGSDSPGAGHRLHPTVHDEVTIEMPSPPHRPLGNADDRDADPRGP
ncbi:hypothetical protein DPM13_12335 [Paracoccus mutanolyticus]|uniref:Uncharacterized protein n=1 Tax=Paracoccus mutanolyticus TaxID=1499308 RepID=A0ABN5MCQ3_9RHOB|nr:hypothetical protein DPM13_12335 [Paracoccus mutanolyticus]